jgi:hypothetical protein
VRIRGIYFTKFNERTQMDLFDMQATRGGPDKDYRYVFHYIDHFTKFGILRPLKDKTKEAVTEQLRLAIDCEFNYSDVTLRS